MATRTTAAADLPMPGPPRPLPHDDEAERLVLGTLMTERGALDRVRDILAPASFYAPLHSSIYAAVTALSDEGDRPDPVSVLARLRRMGVEATPAEVLTVAGRFSYDLEQHAAIVHDKAVRRKFWQLGTWLASNGIGETTDIEDVIDRARTALGTMLGGGRAPAVTMAEALDGVMRRVRGNIDGTAERGAATGLAPFDERCGGLQRGDLVVVAGETSQGKTSLALSMAAHAARPAAYYSLEMRSEQLAARLLAMDTGVPVRDLQGRPLPAPALQRVEQGVERLGGLPLLFDDRCTSNLDTITASIRAMHARHGIEGAVIDYLQILTVNRAEANKEQQMAEAARRLKNLARELGIWVIALSQLNRDTPGTPPVLARLRDSGQIAEAADVVMLIYRPEAYGCRYPYPFADRPTAGTAMIDVAKGRNVGTFRFITAWDAATTRFGDAPPRMGREVRLEM